MARFQTVIKHARFVYSPYTATEMQAFAQVLTDSIRARIHHGQNIDDQAAGPLKLGQSGRRGSPDYKSSRSLEPIRDWTRSGHTLRCLEVLTAHEDRAVIGFLDEACPAGGKRPRGSPFTTTSANGSGACCRDRQGRPGHDPSREGVS